jgi:endo-1,4-beta-xylanase
MTWTRSNQLTPKQRFAAHWKLLIIPVAGVAVGLAIALPASMASTHHTAAPAPPDGAKHHASGAAAHTPAHPATLRLAPPRTGCHVTYAPTNWPGQFTAKVTLTNTGTTRINGWKLAFTFPGDQAISSAWNTTFTQTGHKVSATDTTYYNATIPPGASRPLGFLGTWNSNDTAPTRFRVNGTACS